LLIFAVLALIALTFSAVKYADVPNVIGPRSHEISAEFGDTSGLYTRALVTYRGVDVGKVSKLDITAGGVLVRMEVDGDVKIPTSAVAEIHSTSAIGEQYVDLVPRNGDGPFLADGAVIPEKQTVEMPQISPVLDSLNSLLKSVPEAKTTAVVDEVDAALGGSSKDLSSLIDDTTKVVDEAQEQVSATTELINTASPLLTTQQDLADKTTSYVSSLASFTDQLKISDPDLRALLGDVPPATGAVDTLVGKLTPTLPPLLASSTTTAEMLNAYEPNLRQLLIDYPALQARLQAVLLPHRDTGAAKLDLKTNVNNPPTCISGFLPVTDRRDPSDLSAATTPDGLHCDLTRDAPEAVRGARNAPCPNDPARRSATPAGCGLVFGDPDSADTAAALASAATATDRNSPVGLLDLLGGTSVAPPNASWKSLLMIPLGL
jgi:phospholipid/cholesterol/gamma-HCH transport system substrate-binding protein